MGLFKKLFKPVSKVLDKIVPNELKPFLPYASAALPFLMPAGATGSFMNSMMGRALLSGGANLGSQLAQEGNEGDFDLMSTLMAGGIGALSAPGAAAKLRGMKAQPYGVDRSMSFLDKTKNFGLGALEKGANFIGDAQTTLKTPGFNMDTLTAASVPLIQGTGEVMKYEANSAMKAYEDALAAYDLEQGQFGNDTGRREAILAAMRAYNHPEELIESTLEELGLRDGGRVGYNSGGITDIFSEEVFSKPDFGGITEAVSNIGEENDLVASRQEDLFMLREEAIMKGDRYKILEIESDFLREFNIKMPMSESITEESVTQMAAQGGLMSYNTGGSVLPNGVEIDYRGGGFIPVGSKERADDVPARVSKNEFVMTADAVRAAGGGSVNQGAKKMYNLMNNLEARA
mgnify:FL=1